MQKQTKFYIPDGKVPIRGMLVQLILLICFVLLGLLQAIENTSLSAIFWPFTFTFNIMLLSLLSRYFFVRSRIRNQALLNVTVVAGSILFFYLIAWFEEHGGIPQALFGLAGDDKWFAVSVGSIAPELGLLQMAGISVTLDWLRLGEWGIMIVALLLALNSLFQRKIYCTQCDDWASEGQPVIAFYHLDEPEFAHHLSDVNLDFLDDADPILTEPFQDYYQIEANVCESCNDLFVLAVYRYKKASDLDKGKRRLLLSKLVVSRAAYQHILFEKSKYPVPECSQKN